MSADTCLKYHGTVFHDYGKDYNAYPNSMMSETPGSTSCNKLKVNHSVHNYFVIAYIDGRLIMYDITGYGGWKIMPWTANLLCLPIACVAGQLTLHVRVTVTDNGWAPSVSVIVLTPLVAAMVNTKSCAVELKNTEIWLSLDTFWWKCVRTVALL